MADTLGVVQTRKGKTCISKDGHVFRFCKDGVAKKIWECERRRYDKCPARIHTSESLSNPELLSELGTHNHGANAISLEIRQTMCTIRQRAKATTDSPSQIIARSTKDVSAAARGALPLPQNMKRGIRIARSMAGGSLAIPHRRQDIDLPQAFKTTATGENFILFDSGPADDRILIFGTYAHLEFLKLTSLWLVDGTFKVAPTLFDQLFAIHGVRNGVTFPLIYCLTPNRTTQTYTRILNALKGLNAGLAPTTILSDFEKASINAFAEAFPQAEQKGCFFHFSQCFFRNIQKRPDILHLYSTDSDFSLQIRYLVALAFVPPEDVVATFDHLMEDPFFTRNEELLLDFVNYFERTWIGSWNRRKTARIEPLFAISLWNCFHSVLEGLPKTNNSCEGFHNGFAAMLGSSHPTIYKLIDGLKDQQTLTDLKINQFFAGTIPPRSKKFQLAANKLKAAVEMYGSADMIHIEYLRRLAYCIKSA